MPTPPKESIKGKKLNQELSFEMSKVVYNYIVNMEDFQNSESFITLDENEKNDFNKELTEVNNYYDGLRQRVDKY